MFFIIVLLISALISVLVFVFKIKAVITANNFDISVVVSYLGVIRVRKTYVIKREDESLLALYLVTKRKGLKPVISLTDVIKKIRRSVPTDIAFVDLITVVKQSFGKKKEEKAYGYIYRKIKYDINIGLLVGIEDAFLTALACGILNGVAGAFLAPNNKNKRTIKLKAYPDFSKLNFSVKADCIIELSPADIIIGYAINKKNKRR